MKAVHIDKAIKMAQTFLQNEQNKRSEKAGEQVGSTRVSIYHWHENKKDKPQQNRIGPRVAEVSFFTPKGSGGAGSSLMQVDVPHGAAACLCAERLILAYTLGWTDEEIEEEQERLVYAVFGD